MSTSQLIGPTVGEEATPAICLGAPDTPVKSLGRARAKQAPFHRSWPPYGLQRPARFGPPVRGPSPLMVGEARAVVS